MEYYAAVKKKNKKAFCLDLERVPEIVSEKEHSSKHYT